MTEDKDLLLVTIDGRWAGKAEGMSAKEVTLFLKKHFNPQYALNMDGGGSTTMYVKGKGAAKQMLSIILLIMESLTTMDNVV